VRVTQVQHPDPDSSMWTLLRAHSRVAIREHVLKLKLRLQETDRYAVVHMQNPLDGVLRSHRPDPMIQVVTKSPLKF